jgi:putative PIN family toxin of toxin-antitoxin system
VRIVVDTTILVRATEASHGPARELLLRIIEDRHTMVLSNEMLYELARVLRYPRLLKLYALTEERVYEYITLLRAVAEVVPLSPLLPAPIRDINDIVVAQTAILGEAEVLCTRDKDFYERDAARFLQDAGVTVLDDIALLHRLRG